MALPSIADLKMWVGSLLTKDDWNYNFSKLVGWLADGTSDIVVNSIKSTNGINLDGSQIYNLRTATEGSQAVNLDQALTLLNRTSYYYPFSVASGKVDNDGNAAYLQKDSDTQITVLGGNVNPDLVCIQSDGTVESVTSNTVLTVPVTDGTYHIVKEKGESISITSGSANKVTIDKKFPSSQNTGDYFLDNSVEPFKGYKYGVSGWEEQEFCYLGYVTVSSGTARVKQFPYNDNYYDVNRNNQAVVVETYSSGASWYRVWSDNWCEQGSVTTLSSTNVALMKNYIDTNYVVAISSANGYNENVWVRDKSVSGFNLNAGGYDQNRADWYACGYIS